MRLLDRRFEKHGSGQVKIKIEDDEDLWQLYNLVFVGDTVRASTFRKVQSKGPTGSVVTNKIRLNLTIRIVNVDFDPQSAIVRYSGKVCSESEHVKMGVHHTLEVSTVGERSSGELTIGKDCWDTVVYQRLEKACDSTQKADVAAVVMEEGMAHVCLITPSMTILKQKIEMPIPRKRRSGATEHDAKLTKFFEAVLRAVTTHVNWGIVKCLLVCSPGFVNQDFLKYAMDQAVKRDMKELLKTKSKWMLAQCSGGYMHCLKEVMMDKAVAARLTDTKATDEAKALDRFHDMMKNDEDRVQYGHKPVFAAAEKQAIEALLVLDTVFRSNSVAKRKQFIQLVEDVQELNGEVHIFSSMHGTGQELSNLNGLAAILRFPCPELNELDSEEEIEDGMPQSGSVVYLDELDDDDLL